MADDGQTQYIKSSSTAIQEKNRQNFTILRLFQEIRNVTKLCNLNSFVAQLLIQLNHHKYGFKTCQIWNRNCKFKPKTRLIKTPKGDYPVQRKL